MGFLMFEFLSFSKFSVPDLDFKVYISANPWKSQHFSINSPSYAASRSQPLALVDIPEVHTWSLDANQYVADEVEVTCSCRISGLLLLEELGNAYGSDGIDAILGAVEKRFSESCQMKVAGSTDWWRLREAAIFALISISEEQVPEEDKFQLQNLLQRILNEDIATGVHEYPFLRARAFSAVAKFSLLIDQQVRDRFLYVAINAITLDAPPPVKVGACRAISNLLPESNHGMHEPQIIGLLTSLIDLLKQSQNNGTKRPHR